MPEIAEEAVETSLRDQIASAMDEPADAPEKDDKEGKTVDVSEAARTLASQRKASEQTKVEGTEEKPEQAEAAKPASVESVEAPQHWPATDREMFGKQSPEAQKWLLGRHKAMEADYTRRVQEVAHVRRFQEGLEDIFRPFRGAMQRDGVDDLTAIRQLVGAHQYLQEKPAEAIQWLAQKYGIELNQITGEGSGNAQPDPRFTKLEQTVTQLTQKLGQTERERQEQVMKANFSSVTQFAEEKDASGNLKHPHFDEVAQDIVLLMRASQSAGQPIALQDAYDRAVFANPSVRVKVLAAQEAERKAKEAEERAAKANAAKKAGFDVSGQGAASTSVAAVTNSVREDLEAAFANSGARV